MGACAWCLPLDEPRCQHGSLHFTVQCIGVVCDFTYLVRWHLCLGVLVYVLWVKREALHGKCRALAVYIVTRFRTLWRKDDVWLR
jgi:hypothetical protein